MVATVQFYFNQLLCLVIGSTYPMFPTSLWIPHAPAQTLHNPGFHSSQDTIWIIAELLLLVMNNCRCSTGWLCWPADLSASGIPQISPAQGPQSLWALNDSAGSSGFRDFNMWWFQDPKALQLFLSQSPTLLFPPPAIAATADWRNEHLLSLYYVSHTKLSTFNVVSLLILPRTLWTYLIYLFYTQGNQGIGLQ